MKRFIHIASNLGQGMRRWQMIYMMFFAAFATWANLYVGPLDQLFGDLYLLLSIGSLFIVLPNFRRTLFRPSDPLRNRRHVLTRFARLGWRVYLYLIIPVAFVAILQSFSALMSFFLEFTQTNVTSNPDAADYVTAVLAGIEEVWRWSVIGTVLVACHAVFGRIWHWYSVRGTAFVLAWIVSSLAFGAGHILEFDAHRLRAWILFSGLGALLALMTIVTGRIVLVICVHAAYDIWVTFISGLSGNDVWIGTLVYIALLLAPIVTILWRRSLFHSR